MSLKEQILNADDLGREIIDIPEWNVKIEMRGLSGKQRADMKRKIIDDKTNELDDSKLYKEIMLKCAYDPETGEKIFDEKDGDLIIQKSGFILERLAKVGLRLSGMIDSSIKDMETNF